jgi:hypothetical protein
MHTQEVLGIDLGKTIVTIDGESQKVAFPDAIRVIRRLARERFEGRVHIVSKVDEGQKKRALEWLDESGFYEETGVQRESVHFCAERREKAPICRTLGITHFIDDRPEVMSHMQDIPHRFLFRSIEEDVKAYEDKLSGVIHVKSWIEIEKLIL